MTESDADDCSDDGDLPEGEIARRVVFDIGSDTTKCVIADVDHEASSIIEVCFAEVVTVSYGLDRAQSADGTLSKRVQDRGLQVLSSMAKKSPGCGGGC